jgi:hypothetical protein
VESLRFRKWWKHKHHGLEMGGTSGDHERGLLAPFYHCLMPRGGGVFLLIIKSIYTKLNMVHIFYIKKTKKN